MPNSPAERTYYTDCDYALDNSSTTNIVKSIYWAFKASLKKEILNVNSAPVTAWTCEGSSDASTAGMDGVDRLGTSSFDATKWTKAAAGVAHTWIVLRNSTIGVWLTLDWITGLSDSAISMYISSVAPTGGTTLNRPTSTNEVILNSGSWNMILAIVGTTACKAHRCFDSEGYFIFGVSQNGSGVMHTILALQKVTEYRASDPYPWVFIKDTGTNATSAALLGANTTAVTTTLQWRCTAPASRCFAVDGLTTMSVVPAFWASSSTNLWQGGTQTLADAADGKFDDAPVYMLGITGSVSVKGRLYDWRLTAGPATLSIFPAAVPSMTHMVMGNCWIPWTAVPTL